MHKPKANVLLVEDDKNLGFVVKDFLTDSGYEVDLCENGIAGSETFDQKHYDIILIDVMLPLLDGFSLAERIRSRDTFVPIIFMTARSMKEDKIRGFKVGADDYITKPFSTEELLLRMEAILRRTLISLLGNQTTKEVFVIGKYTFDALNQQITLGENKRTLTPKESGLLRLLCLNKNQVIRREIALKLIWGEDDYFMGRSMDVYITKLRKILKDDPSISIQNVHRTGFKLEVLEESEN
jgi:DNA-binding response OmpR family regulator